MTPLRLTLVTTLLLLQLTLVCTFDVHKGSNLVGYWGQNSYGNVEDAKVEHMEKPLADYCRDATYDVIVLSFLVDFQAEKKEGYPVLNLGKHCPNKFPNSDHPACPEVAMGIKYCQNQGKAVLLSMGGYAGDYTIKNHDDATNLATRLWDLYLGGSAEHRPFGDTVLDGIDLDIEKGPPESYAVLTNQLKSMFNDEKRNTNRKRYYISAAPQCPFPDQYLKNTLEHGWLDMVFVQFYNNPCGLGQPQFNFNLWDKWATSQSKNSKVKIYLGAPASVTAAGSGYLDFPKLETVLQEVQGKYKSFGGVMLWDISQANMNLCKETQLLFSVSISHALKGKHPVSQPGYHTHNKNRILASHPDGTKFNRPDPTQMEKVEKLPRGVNQSLKSNLKEEEMELEGSDSVEAKGEAELKEKDFNQGADNQPKVSYHQRSLRSMKPANSTQIEVESSRTPTPITNPAQTTSFTTTRLEPSTNFNHVVGLDRLEPHPSPFKTTTTTSTSYPTKVTKILRNTNHLNTNSTQPQPNLNLKVKDKQMDVPRFDDGQYRPENYLNYQK